jgi:putative DNA methylase
MVNGQPKDRTFFENTMARAFAEGRRVLREDGIGSVVFAHKTTEGWEALLSGMIRGGWTITGSWPIATERPGRLRSQDSAALATSIHLVCRPRPEDAPVGDWGEVLRELPGRVHDWMERLQGEGVRGADLVFACIGPALEIYSRYSKVLDAEDRPVPLGGDPETKEPHLRGYLAYVWEIVGRTALERVLGTAEAKARNGAAGALEEDARLTALFLWTLQTTATDAAATADETDNEAEPDDADGETLLASGKGLSLVFDVARRFAQPLGIHLENWEGRIIQTTKGVVRLLPVTERAEQLFGKDGAQTVADRIESGAARTGSVQLTIPGMADAPAVKGRKSTRSKSRAGAPGLSLQARQEPTTLDRVHAAMLLQAGGRTNALRSMLKDELDRGPDFLRLANALSALYPLGSEEKRLLDAMLLAVPR